MNGNHTIIFEQPDGKIVRFRAPNFAALCIARFLAGQGGLYGNVAVMGPHGIAEVNPDGSLEVCWSNGSIDRYDNRTSVCL